MFERRSNYWYGIIIACIFLSAVLLGTGLLDDTTAWIALIPLNGITLMFVIMSIQAHITKRGYWYPTLSFMRCGDLDEKIVRRFTFVHIIGYSIGFVLFFIYSCISYALKLFEYHNIIAFTVFVVYSIMITAFIRVNEKEEEDSK